MMKLSNFLRSRSNRNVVPEKLLMGKVNNVTNASWMHNITTEAGMLPENRSSSIIPSYAIFKGKAALSSAPFLPKSNKFDAGSKYKKGCVMLTFWPAVGERVYNWEKRQVFALSPTELGSLISLEPGKSCEFFHDPAMKSSNAGQVRKSLSVSPIGDGSGYLFNLNVVNNNLKTNDRFSVPVSKAEFTVMRTAYSFILPHIVGWNQVTQEASSGPNPSRQQETRSTPYIARNQMKQHASSTSYPVRQQEIKPALNSEWGK